VSDPGLRGLRTCALAVPIAALLAAFGLGATSSGAQPSGTYCDAAYCYVQTCERLPPNCHYVTERVCHPIVKQECFSRARGLEICDLGSSNGTLLDDRPIGQDYVALAGVRSVSFGGFEMEVVGG
jgi:hypothetical protein